MIGRRRGLRVLVSPTLRTAHHPESGHGRVWRHGLAALAALTPVVEADPARRARGDVWLTDVFDPPPAPGRPVLGYVSEAPWADPAATVGLDPTFLAEAAALSRRGAARADRLTVPARTSAAQAAAVLGVPADRIDVVALGVDVARFAAGVPARGQALAGDAPYVLFAGQVHARKNLGALRAAIEALAAEGVIRTLVVLASPAVDRQDSTELLHAALAPLQGAELHTLPRPDDAGLADLMAGAAVVCVPSLWEGFGLVAAEAMAAGAPVVVSDRGALPEVVLDAGVIRPPTPEAIADGIRAALADAPRLRAAGRARAAQLTWAHTARGWLAALERTAQEG